MPNASNLRPQPVPVIGCTIARDVQAFELLITEMEAAFGENWSDLGFEAAAQFLREPAAAVLEFVAIAVDHTDMQGMADLTGLIGAAKARGIRVTLIAKDAPPAALHRLLGLGADDVVPYPLRHGALLHAIDGLHARGPRPAYVAKPAGAGVVPLRTRDGRQGTVLGVHGLAGGAGSSVFALNLAWELATLTPTGAPRVCLIDLDFQFGSASTYLGLHPRDTVGDILAGTCDTDMTGFTEALQQFHGRLHVLTAPADLQPSDIAGPDDIARLIGLSCSLFDYVVIDMPTAVAGWTGTVLHQSRHYFALIEQDLRSAQNASRFVRAMSADGLPVEKLRFALNRAPGFADLAGRARARRLAETLATDIGLYLPDGGAQVGQSNDHGLPLALAAPGNALRREIRKLAHALHAPGCAEARAAD